MVSSIRRNFKEPGPRQRAAKDRQEVASDSRATRNKTAINKDEVRIRTADSFNQIRNIKVASKAKERGRKDGKVDEPSSFGLDVDIPRGVEVGN